MLRYFKTQHGTLLNIFRKQCKMHPDMPEVCISSDYSKQLTTSRLERAHRKQSFVMKSPLHRISPKSIQYTRSRKPADCTLFRPFKLPRSNDIQARFDYGQWRNPGPDHLVIIGRDPVQRVPFKEGAFQFFGVLYNMLGANLMDTHTWGQN